MGAIFDRHATEGIKQVNLLCKWQDANNMVANDMIDAATA